MSIEEIINDLGTKIQGYAGYYTIENRQDTMDVFTAWSHGRLKKKMSDLETHYKSWSALPEIGEIALVYSKVIETLTTSIKHLKYDSRDIVPFLGEQVIFEENILNDLVRLDNKAYVLEEKFCKLLETLDRMTVPAINEAYSILQNLLVVLRERTKRINILNKIFHVMRENISLLCSKINSENLDERTIQGISILIEKYPKRVETYEKIMVAFKEARSMYQNYNERPNLVSKYAMYMLYLENLPLLLERSRKFMENFVPVTDKEKKSLENLKNAVENPPDFEKLRQELIVAKELKLKEINI